MEATNDVRRQIGLKLFVGLPALNQAADLQAGANALSVTARHFDIVNAWATPTDRVRSFGLVGAVSENVALLSLFDFDVTHSYTERAENGERLIFDGSTGQIAPRHSYASFARTIVLAWMASPGHRANVVNPKFVNMGRSARASRSISGLDMMAGVQVFFIPDNAAVRR